MNIAIVGSRDYPNLQAVVDYVNQLPTGTVVISGEARGVDRTAKEAALARGLGYLPFPADWTRYGKRAGFLRNADIVNASDKIVAFWDGKSKGTKHTIHMARLGGKEVEVIYP